jgi:hypothetical protein
MRQQTAQLGTAPDLDRANPQIGSVGPGKRTLIEGLSLTGLGKPGASAPAAAPGPSIGAPGPATGPDKATPGDDTLHRLFKPSGPKPGPTFPEDRPQAERKAMEDQARKHYEQTLIETGAPPKWDAMLRGDPKFARAVEGENDRIYHEAMDDRAQRRGTELGIMQRNEDERARAPHPREPAAPTNPLDALPRAAFNNLLGFLPPEGHRALREVDHQRRDGVRDFHQARAPHTDKTSFASATTGHYPNSFAKSEYTNREVDLKSNLGLSWQEYQKGGQIKSGDSPGPGYVERMDDNRFLFHDQRVEPQLRTNLERSGRLFSPSQGIWTPQMNDAWLLGLLHAGLPIHLLSQPDRDCLWDAKEDRPTQTGRELLLMLNSGWRVLPRDQVMDHEGMLEPFESGGIVLVPPDHHAPPRIHDAEPPNPSGQLAAFSDQHAGEFTPPEIAVDHRTSGYDTVTKQGIRQDYIQRRFAQLKKIAGKYLNNTVSRLTLEGQLAKIAKKKIEAQQAKIEQRVLALANNLQELEGALATAGLNPEEIEQLIEQIALTISSKDLQLAGVAEARDKLYEQLRKKKK